MLSFSSNVKPLVKDDFAIPHRTAQSQYIITAHKPHTLSLRHFKFSFNGFTDFYTYKVVPSSDMRKNEAQSCDRLASIMPVVLKL